jgi:chemotaxis protein MotB
MKRRNPNDSTFEPTFDGPDTAEDDPARQPSYHRPVRHRGNAVVAWGFVVILVVALGFVAMLFIEPLKQQLHATQTLLADANRSITTLQQQLTTLEAARGDLEQQRDGLAHQVLAREHKAAELQAATQQIHDIFSVDIDRGNMLVRQHESDLVVNIAADLLFEDNEAQLTEGGKLILRKAGAALGRAPGRDIEVGGHTDNQPLSAKLIRTFPSNWELSCARAAEVAKFLEQSGGIPAARLIAAGYAGTRPLADNAHAPGRRRNQRVALTLRAAASNDEAPLPGTEPPEGADLPDKAAPTP